MNPIENSKGKFIDLVLPVVVLVITCVWGLMKFETAAAQLEIGAIMQTGAAVASMR